MLHYKTTIEANSANQTQFLLAPKGHMAEVLADSTVQLIEVEYAN